MELYILYGLIIVFVAALARLAQLTGVEMLKEYHESYLTSQRSQMADMFIAVDPARIFSASCGIAIIFALILYIAFGNLPVAVLVLIIIPVTAGMAARVLRSRRYMKFESQFPDALSRLNASIRAGASLENALIRLAQQSYPPMSQEMGMLEKELKLGKNEVAYKNLAKRIPMPSVTLFVTSVLTCNRLGGNLTEMTDKISDTIRTNIQLRQELKTLTAEGRTQGIVMGVMPFIMAGLMYLVDPDTMRPLWTTTIGNILICVVVFLELVGFVIIREILKIE